VSNTSDEFGEVLERWKQENEMPWGRLRYDTSRMNIARHTGKKKLRILDVGGGNGIDPFIMQNRAIQLPLRIARPQCCLKPGNRLIVKAFQSKLLSS